MNHGVEVATAAGTNPIVVLGANGDLLQATISNTNTIVIVNEGWEEGMAASIRCGLQKLVMISPSVEATILMVCDQPLVTTALLISLAQQYRETGKPIIASSYANSMGTPALFDKTFFAPLLALKGDEGAKAIIKKNTSLVAIVDFPPGNIDIDTREEYEALLNNTPTGI